MQIYTDKRGALEKLIDDANYESIAEIYDFDGRLIGGLFRPKEVSE
ncbi:hypothetical protein AABM38_10100 [Heyndrickxia sp. MSNUG]